MSIKDHLKSIFDTEEILSHAKELIMTDIKPSYTDILNRASDFNDILVSVEGTLVVEYNNSYLEVGEDLIVHIYDHSFMNRILDHVPCYVGGQYLYKDEGTILQGIFYLKNDMFYLKEIQRVRIYRDDQIFEF
ncbi:MAG: hypothetical protein I8H74_02900 [Moraxellaceae bacterium]|nr:hypothetical protein [Moraxellaceae bacterium]